MHSCWLKASILGLNYKFPRSKLHFFNPTRSEQQKRWKYSNFVTSCWSLPTTFNHQTDDRFQTGCVKNRQTNWIRHGCTSDHHFRAHFVSSSMFTYFPFGAQHTSLQITFSRITNLFSLCQAMIRIKMKFTFHRKKSLKTRATTNNFERNFHFLCVEFQFRDRFLHNKRFAFEN